MFTMLLFVIVCWFYMIVNIINTLNIFQCVCISLTHFYNIVNSSDTLFAKLLHDYPFLVFSLVIGIALVSLC